ncbi:DUF1831 domain-containing protein [Apilactobacillus xinyiensis]|jgi:hypothetical protein|uniref:DUF1831 domain-containing protein n=1 Tax=Apilactobacillus xinyiensis TaxID=2841032 RepID=A0ABT0I1Y4_9LACO|nr:DUF1831 domain-containing protein [Apilactobacillus xinyiensis]MCK8624738.1 DUF1831 domain-containing protein [Apilactobacillus xinyiensis]MCL0318853.1 DUF1831 domain-containing protein [Apilactobacillus xinyiensis]
MAFSNENKLLGDNTTYRINPNIKKFTLRDLGFNTTNAGNFLYERSLDVNNPYGNGIKIKITFKADLSGFKMSIVTGNGMQKVNIFKDDQHQSDVDQVRFILNNLIEREVITQA